MLFYSCSSVFLLDSSFGLFLVKTINISCFRFSADEGSGTSQCGSTQISPAKQKPLLIQPDTRHAASGESVKFVCPLILTPDSSAPKAESSEEPVQAEPQQACVSTAKGTAYSPSPSDGAVTPAQVGVWERIHSPKDSKNHLQMKLKLTSPDQKLLLPCVVQLVNMLTIPEMKTEGDDAVKTLNANNKSGRTIPKDLRRHQGPHTGHRLCCFTRCDNDVWRLQNIVTHSRDGYVCGNCGKAFKRRKILRRHERFHTGEKPYACSKCSKTFALRKSLRRHLRFHTGERPHTCPQCGKSFRLRDNLKAHLRFHSGEKPFSCTTCGKTFRIMRNMEKHKLSQCNFFLPSFRKIAAPLQAFFGFTTPLLLVLSQSNQAAKEVLFVEEVLTCYKSDGLPLCFLNVDFLQFTDILVFCQMAIPFL
uniref:C2H2-type domain-containing protein n=1 Tax=Poecilia reticulata TaxID=8081 RepID=A0A3P9QDK4_POERE